MIEMLSLYEFYLCKRVMEGGVRGKGKMTGGGGLQLCTYNFDDLYEYTAAFLCHNVYLICSLMSILLCKYEPF